MNEVRIIKRYANRKLYDTQHSRYVTLDQISEMIRNGDDVKIIDNKTKEDLTSVTLAQIIFEEEKKQRSFLPLQAMRNIIQNGGESFAQFVTEAQRRVTSILPRRKDDEERRGQDDDSDEASADSGEEQSAAAAAPPPAEPEGNLPATTPGSDRPRARPSLLEFREWIQQSQRAIEEWQKRMDDRIRNVAEGISPFAGVHKELRELAARIGELEAKLAKAAESEGHGSSATTQAPASGPESEESSGGSGQAGSPPGELGAPSSHDE